MRCCPKEAARQDGTGNTHHTHGADQYAIPLAKSAPSLHQKDEPTSAGGVTLLVPALRDVPRPMGQARGNIGNLLPNASVSPCDRPLTRGSSFPCRLPEGLVQTSGQRKLQRARARQQQEARRMTSVLHDRPAALPITLPPSERRLPAPAPNARLDETHTREKRTR